MGSGAGVGARRSLAVVVAAAFIVFVALLAATRAAGVPATYALADPPRFSGSRFVGVVTTVGLLLWGSALTACLLPLSTIRVAQAERAFLWSSAGLTLMLLLDDWLLIHEAVGSLAGSGEESMNSLLEGTVYFLFLIVFLVYARRFWARLSQADGRAYLAAALLLFAASSAFDLLEIVYEVGEASKARAWVVSAEEGLKFSGILFWVVFYWSVAREALDELPVASDPVTAATSGGSHARPADRQGHRVSNSLNSLE